MIAAVTIALGRMVDPRSCRVFSSELKIRVAATGLTTYPDVTVVCGEAARDAEDPNALANPKLLVEVLSPSTEAYDRGEKWAHYRRLDSLEAYLLVSQLPERVEIYERIPAGQGDPGAFSHRLAGRGEDLTIRCLGGGCCTSTSCISARSERPSSPSGAAELASLATCPTALR